mmetsp:Transcript_26551/g.62016  ORF Transcript_26551/g.62016 Transcript_26551/m.62016 type:complete len:259 (-) Transcript_26551:52-828(-)|eukprot:CAMPEP_0178420476 /NCGR_PEP_ID=MMETSP0689_2-20121128/26150_1 /TAXON_ID=160604 /ORGANISM="Amphidinium massartii, Strain CS-259" /LENGTH=258 /DNA_ID=CAMNT_0020041955 /DNA_START=282 /DNA_END=1058 /DNA_ORIENTATION=-
MSSFKHMLVSILLLLLSVATVAASEEVFDPGCCDEEEELDLVVSVSLLQRSIVVAPTELPRLNVESHRDSVDASSEIKQIAIAAEDNASSLVADSGSAEAEVEIHRSPPQTTATAMTAEELSNDVMNLIVETVHKAKESAEPGSHLRSSMAAKFSLWAASYKHFIQTAVFSDFLELMKTSFACMSVFAVLRALRRNEDIRTKVSAIIWCGEMQTLLCLATVPPLLKAPALALPLLTAGTLLNGGYLLLSKEKLGAEIL